MPARSARRLAWRTWLQGTVRREQGWLQVTTHSFQSTAASGLGRDHDRRWRDVLAVQEEIAGRGDTLGIAPAETVAQQRSRRRSGTCLARVLSRGVSALRTSGDLSQLNVATEWFQKAPKSIRISCVPSLRCAKRVCALERTRAMANVEQAEPHCRQGARVDAPLRQPRWRWPGCTWSVADMSRPSRVIGDWWRAIRATPMSTPVLARPEWAGSRGGRRARLFDVQWR